MPTTTIDEQRTIPNGPLKSCAERKHPVLVFRGMGNQLGAPTGEDAAGWPMSGWFCAACNRAEFHVAFSGNANGHASGRPQP